MGGSSRGKDGELDESYGEKNDPSDHEDTGLFVIIIYCSSAQSSADVCFKFHDVR